MIIFVTSFRAASASRIFFSVAVSTAVESKIRVFAFHQRTRDAETLLLASGEVACALLEHGIEPSGMRSKFIHTRRAACFPDLLIGCIRIASFQVFTHGSENSTFSAE